MLSDKQKKILLPLIIVYILVTFICKLALRTISPIFIIIFIALPLIYISLVFLKEKGEGIARVLNILFVVLLNISIVILGINVIVMEKFPAYLQEHNNFFDVSLIIFVIMFLLSALVGAFAKVISKRK